MISKRTLPSTEPVPSFCLDAADYALGTLNHLKRKLIYIELILWSTQKLHKDLKNILCMLHKITSTINNISYIMRRCSNDY